MKYIKLFILFLFTSSVTSQPKDGYWDNIRTTNETLVINSGERKFIKTAEFPEGTTELVYRISLLDDNQKLSSSLVSLLKAIPDPTGISQGTAGAVFLLSTMTGSDKCKYAVFTNEKDALQHQKSGDGKNACYQQNNPINKEAKLLSANSKCLTSTAKNLWFVFENTNWVMNEKIVIEVVPWIDTKLSSGWTKDAKKEVIAICKSMEIIAAVIKKDQFCGYFLEAVMDVYSYRDFKDLLIEEKAKVVEDFTQKALDKIGENTSIRAISSVETRQLFDEGKKQQAIEILENAIKNKKASVADYYQLGQMYLYTRQFDKALKIGIAAEQLDKTDLKIKLSLAHAYLFLDEFAKAKEIYKQYKSQNISANISWSQQLKNDFKTFENYGLDNSKFKRVLNLLD